MGLRITNNMSGTIDFDLLDEDIVELYQDTDSGDKFVARYAPERTIKPLSRPVRFIERQFIASCPNCGMCLAGDENYCPNCGAKIIKEEEQ